MCKTCIKPIYGGTSGDRWGSVISTSQYDSPLDLSREKDSQRPPLPTHLRQQPALPSDSPPQSPSPPQTPPPPHQLNEKPSASKLDASAQHSNLSTEDVFETDTPKRQHGVTPRRGEVGTLTDIHSQDNVAEVDLISLVEEQIPKYVLRADTLTDFAGYDNQDFARNPALPPDTDLGLSPELVEETLKYFVLCSERVSQMTKTYHDIEAVTRLLEEKESDLELAARIGQGLLEKNKTLQTKNEHLEEFLCEASEKISQLRHEVTMKDALLQMYREDTEHDITPHDEEVAVAGLSDSDVLQKKVKQLEDENQRLKVQTDELTQATDSLEEQEMHLVSDCVQQLDTANRTVRQLQDELNTKGDVCHRQQEENTALLGKLISVEGKHDKQIHENDELRQQVVDLQTTQMELTQELAELEERYEECVSLLYEKQTELKTLRKKAAPSVIHQHYGTSPFFMPEGSLALELEKSQTEESCPEDYKAKSRRNHTSRVLETAKSVRRAIDRASSSASLTSSMSMWSEDDSVRSSLCTTDIDSDTPSVSELDNSSHLSLSGLGKPGVPGSNDLETALHRLTRDQENDQLNQNMEQAVDRRGEDDNTPTPCPTPDSYMSTGSAANPQNMYRIPEKLQIVKPMEGSLTLQQWQKLATPRLEGLLETRPGVQIRGNRSLEMDEEVYSITDIEEDDDLAYLLAKSVEDTAATYTYTTSKVMHPSQQYTPNNSVVEVTQSATRPSNLPLQHKTPDSHGTSTFSMNLGLATALQERDTAEKETSQGEDEMGDTKGLMSYLTSWLSAPRRFNSLVTESPVCSNQSHTSTVYTQASMYVPALPGIDSKPRPHRPEAAYLQLVAKMEDLGPANILGIAEQTGISPVKQDPVDVGLNTMMYIRRNRITGVPGLNTAQTLRSGSRKEKSPRAGEGVINRLILPQPLKGGSSAGQSGVNRSAVPHSTPLRRGSGRQSVVNRSALQQTSPLRGASGGQFEVNRSALPHTSLLRSGQSIGQSVSTPKYSTAMDIASTPKQITKTSTTDSASTPKHVINGARSTASAPKHTEMVPGYTMGTSVDRLGTSLDWSGTASQGINLMSSPDTSMTSKELYTNPVLHTSMSGLGYAVSPPSIQCVTTAREEVYITPPYSGNVGTGTVHSPLHTSRHSKHRGGGGPLVASAEARVRLLGQAVRSRESCAMIGGLTSTPLNKS